MDHAKFYQLAHRQKGAPDKLGDLEAAVVAYGRWQGLSEESEPERQQAKELLDRIADELEPDDWQNLHDYNTLIGRERIRELIAYTFKRAYEDIKERTREVERLRDENPPDDDTDTQPKRKRRRERER